MIRYATLQDIDQWLDLAKEVESLFGKMAGLADFEDGIKACIAHSSAFCATHAEHDIAGIVAIDKEQNEIAWLAVKNTYRGAGYGRQLLETAIEHLDTTKPIYVQTFSAHVALGTPARKLYMRFGFNDDRDGGKNPAGIDTTIMKLG